MTADKIEKTIELFFTIILMIISFLIIFGVALIPWFNIASFVHFAEKLNINVCNKYPMTFLLIYLVINVLLMYVYFF